MSLQVSRIYIFFQDDDGRTFITQQNWQGKKKYKKGCHYRCHISKCSSKMMTFQESLTHLLNIWNELMFSNICSWHPAWLTDFIQSLTVYICISHIQFCNGLSEKNLCSFLFLSIDLGRVLLPQQRKHTLVTAPPVLQQSGDACMLFAVSK